MKRNLILLLALILGVCSCEISTDVLEVGQGAFELTADCDGAGTKLSVDEDGLGLTWNMGDRLYLVSADGQNPTVTLSSDITEPAKSATFRSKGSVPAGEYVVMYGDYDGKLNQPSTTLADDISNQIVLFGSLRVETGQTSASIKLKHAFAKLEFNFKNVPASLTSVNCGMCVDKEGVPVPSDITATREGLTYNITHEQKISFGWNGGRKSYILMVPTDFTGKKMFFYVYGNTPEGIRTYEFQKAGKELKAGINYSITLDFNSATNVSTLTTNDDWEYLISTPAQFRAASYSITYGNYLITNNIDFKDEVCFPLRGAMSGGLRTISNATIELEECNNVGIVSEGAISNTVLSNITIKGKSTVGIVANGAVRKLVASDIRVSGKDQVGIVGSGTASDLNATGVTIRGRQEVGGAMGYCNDSSSSHDICMEDVTVRGSLYVGGIAGYAYAVTRCTLRGGSSIEGEDYIGGICGYSRFSLSDCLVTGGSIQVKGNDYTGGISGVTDRGTVSECGFEGTVSGGKFVGGICGSGSTEKCYTKGNVSATGTLVGGICGDGTAKNSYMIGDVTSTQAAAVAGISGSSKTSSNCYSYGTVSSGIGIAPGCDPDLAACNLTSCAKQYESGSIESCCGYGASKPFLQSLSAINGDGAYSSEVWPGIDAKCPLLQWQCDLLNGTVTLPGFGNEEL